MNTSEMVTQTRYLIDEYTIEVNTLISLFNQALDDLSTAARKTKKATIPVTGKAFTLPDDCMDIISVVQKTRSRRKRLEAVSVSEAHGFEKETDDQYSNADGFYTLYDRQAEIHSSASDGDEIELVYYGTLSHLPYKEADSNLSSIPELPPHFHRVLPTFAAYKYFQNWEMSAGQTRMFAEEYFGMKAEIEAYCKKKEVKHNRSNQVYQVRGWY